MKPVAPRPSCLGPDDRVVCFDGVCKFCGAWVKIIHRNDARKRIKLAALQSDQGVAIRAWAGLSLDDIDTMIYVDRGNVRTRSGAALRVAWQLRFPWPLLSVFLVVPWFIRDWCYNRIAKNRYKLFGKEESCLMPTPELRERFLK
jgi:predicted DCC family thiol-disulfide oxidoreductase YuxK